MLKMTRFEAFYATRTSMKNNDKTAVKAVPNGPFREFLNNSPKPLNRFCP